MVTDSRKPLAVGVAAGPAVYPVGLVVDSQEIAQETFSFDNSWMKAEKVGQQMQS